MIVASEHQAKLRQKEIQEQRIRELVRDKQGAAAIGLTHFSLNT